MLFTDGVVALPQKKRVLRGRRLVVVDIENVLRGGVASVESAVGGRRAIAQVAELPKGEQVVIGVSHVGLVQTALAWPGARVVVRSGLNGADLALLDVLEGERVEERFDEILLVSGDGIFTPAVATLGARGVAVTVLAHVDGCAASLRLAAARTLYFNSPAAGVGSAA